MFLLQQNNYEIFLPIIDLQTSCLDLKTNSHQLKNLVDLHSTAYQSSYKEELKHNLVPLVLLSFILTNF